MKSRWKATLLLLLTFVGGVIAGGAAVAVAERGEGRGKSHRHKSSEDHIEFMARRLELTQVQQDSVRAILERYKPRMDTVWRQLGTQFETIKDSISTDIRRQLNPEQQARYTEMLERYERERRGDGHRHKD